MSLSTCYYHKYFHYADEAGKHSHTELNSSNRGRLLRISLDSIFDEIKQLDRSKVKHGR